MLSGSTPQTDFCALTHTNYRCPCSRPIYPANRQRFVACKSSTRLAETSSYKVRGQVNGFGSKGAALSLHAVSQNRATIEIESRTTLSHTLHCFALKTQEVLLRVPMHKIGWVMHYTEHTGQQIVVIEAGIPGSSNYKYYLYQASSEVCHCQQYVQTLETCKCISCMRAMVVCCASSQWLFVVIFTRNFHMHYIHINIKPSHPWNDERFLTQWSLLFVSHHSYTHMTSSSFLNQPQGQAQKMVELFNDAFQLVHSTAVLERA